MHHSPPFVILMTVRLKGRVELDLVSAVTGLRPEEIAPIVETAVRHEWLVEKGGRYRITPTGREEIARLAAEERSGLDLDRVERLYEAFDAHNSRLKQVVTAWQIKPDGQTNDHTDPAYDSRVADMLVTFHGEVVGWLTRLGAEIPRLSRYAERLVAAIDAVNAGDLSFIARPIADSYHTVWFELHEELIVALGRNRAEEAAAGRAL